MGYPCALGMATPLAMIRGGGIAAQRGILIRSAAAFQAFGQIRHILLDKTGTLTVGHPRLLDVLPYGGVAEAELLGVAALAETRSEHPIARAIVEGADEQGIIVAEDVDLFEAHEGHGVSVQRAEDRVIVGEPGWVAEQAAAAEGLADLAAGLEAQARTVVAVARAGRLLGLLGIADAVKPDAAVAVQALKARGMRPVLITGDSLATAAAVAAQVGIDEVFARVLPGDKAARIRQLQARGERVAMVGDGINDAPALMQADVGIAIGAGTDIAIESADVILVGERLTAIAEARDIGVASYRKTKQNVALAFAFNGIGVPLAATGLVHPVWAMIAMAASVTTVLANSFGGRVVSSLIGGSRPAQAGRAMERGTAR